MQLQIPLSDSYTDYAGLVPAHVPTSMSGNSNSGTKTNVSTGNSQGTKADLTGTTNGTAAAKTADLQKNVMYFMAAIVSGAVLLILADNRRKRKHGE